MKDFSIVIASAVRNSLPKILQSINNSTLLPKQVIVSIPLGKEYLPNDNYNFSIEVISESVGQVSQRIAGFKKVKTKICI